MDRLTFKDRFILWSAPWIGKLIIQFLGLTISVEEVDPHSAGAHRNRDQRVIYAFWHSRMLMAVSYFRGLGLGVLVSLSKDGELISRIIEKFGFQPLRGSASRGGTEALRRMMQTLKAGGSLGVTPDGPRGPREKAQDGVIFLAQQSGVPIHPFCFNASRRVVFRSWDRFILPLPFSRGVFVWGKPITVPRKADAALREQKRKELERELARVTEVSETYFERPRPA